MSLFSARSGVMYTMLMPGCRPPPSRNLWRTGSIAASVFPVAVAEMRSTFLPSRILGISRRWGSVGLSKPFWSMSLLTGRHSWEKTLSSVKASATFYAAWNIKSISGA